MTKAPDDAIRRTPHNHSVLAALRRATPVSVLGHAINVTIALVAFAPHVKLLPLMFWAVASYGVGGWVFLRWINRRGLTKTPPLHRRVSSTRRALLVGVALAAPWGVLSYWLLGELPQQAELILIALCVGMSASGSVLLSATYPSAIAYMTVVLAPVIFKCFVVLGDGEYRLLGALTISFGLFLLNCIHVCFELFADRNRVVDELSRSLFETNAARHDSEETHKRLDDALHNMPQGLSMYDGDDRLVAFNRQYLDIYGLSPEVVRTGMKFQDVFANQTLVPDAIEYLHNFKKRLSAFGYSSNTVTFPDGRVVYISYALNSTGGWVATHEDITQRKIFERKIEQLAHFDGLTNLANRNLFRDRIEEELARHRRVQTEFAVLLLDLDKFKAVNDALGHQAGDSLLQQVADRIRATIREVDLPARLGGDEFGLIALTGSAPCSNAIAMLATRLINAISAPYEICDRSVVIGCSVGIALVPTHGERADEILRKADLALYESKNSGKNCITFYSDELAAKADKRNILEIELREAIWRDEIEIVYQPIVDLSSGRVEAVEALARWQHSTLGMIPPSVFVPIAEEVGLISDLGVLVLAKACRDARSLPDYVKVAVNLSAAQFAKGDIVEAVIFGLADSGLREDRLEIEITESVFLANDPRNLRALEQLQKIGISIALDDFGVGYSSLSYLTAFPFDKVKIDKSFVANIDRPETGAVLSSIVHLSKALNLKLVVEGIETSHQLDKLRPLEVPLGQGYLFGKPVPLAELDFGFRRSIGENGAMGSAA